MNEEEYQYAIRPNKEQRKRELKTLHSLGRELVELSEAQFATMPLSEHIKEQIISAKKFKKSALQRQLRFLSGLMQEEDVAGIQEALRLIKLPHKKTVEHFHRLEFWRDKLIAGDNNVFVEILDLYPMADRQQLRQLIRNATKQATQNKAPKAARLLFTYLQELQ
jgi:ribosome-associated protein